MTARDPWAGRTPRRWQGEAYDAGLGALRRGLRRVLIHAATGTGKGRLVGAFAAACKGTVLITTPTQALVEQLCETVSEHCGAARVGRCYQRAWEIGADVVVCCIPSLPAVLAERPSWSCWLADEAHRLEGASTREVREQLQSMVAIGLTATPYTATGRGLVLWDELVYSYTSYQAILDGVLVPLRVERAGVEGDVDDLTQAWVAHARGPGIVSAVSVADAEAYAQRIGALAVHGYLAREEQLRRIEALRVGAVRCLVHCQLLTEGVDLPWLEWLALRRPVSSPVRLVQEVGRILRASPGKTEAVVYDPHDALGAVGLVHAAQLEDVQRRAAPAEDGPTWEIPELPGLEEISGLPRAKAISALEGWATDALAVLRSAGVAKLPTRADINPAGPWRRKPATPKQRSAAQRWVSAAQHLAEPAHRAAVDLLLGDERLRAGVASDVLGILVAVGRSPKRAQRVQLPPIRLTAAEAA